MKREFTPKQLKELREVNPWLTDGLFNEIVKDLYEDYSFYTLDEGLTDNYAFNQVMFDLVDIKVVNTTHLLIGASNYPLNKDPSAYRELKRYYTLKTKYDEDYFNELASLFKEAFTNVYRVYVDEETKKIAFAFWL